MEDNSQRLVAAEVQVLSGEGSAWAEVTKHVNTVQDDSVEVVTVANSPLFDVGKWGANEINDHRTEVEEVLQVLGHTSVLLLGANVLGVWDVVKDRAGALRNAAEFKNAY
jgi:hypothetical protein